MVVGMLGAVPLANASGFQRSPTWQEPGQSPVVWICGFIVFVVALATLGPACRFIASTVAALGRMESKPSTAAAIGMMACGTTCLLTALSIAWMSSSSGPLAGLNQSLQGMQEQLHTLSGSGVTLNLGIPQIAAGANTGAGSRILSTVTSIVGLALIGLGVWATLPPVRGLPPVKRPIPAADAASL